MKRRGKSPPPGGQPLGHEKPRVVQDKTGGVWRLASLAFERGRSRVLVAPCLGRAFRSGGTREMTVTRGVPGPRVTEFGLPPPAAYFASRSELRWAEPFSHYNFDLRILFHVYVGGHNGDAIQMSRRDDDPVTGVLVKLREKNGMGSYRRVHWDF